MLCRREDLDKKDAEYLYKNLRICAEHFEDIMLSKDLKNHLNPEAKPILFNIPNPPATVGMKRRAIEKKQYLIVKAILISVHVISYGKIYVKIKPTLKKSLIT